MKLYRKQLQHKVYEFGGQGSVDQLRYEGEWLWEDDPQVETVVAEAEKLVKELGWARLEVKERYVEVANA